jgi:hypothetical protein
MRMPCLAQRDGMFSSVSSATIAGAVSQTARAVASRPFNPGSLLASCCCLPGLAVQGAGVCILQLLLAVGIS